MFRKKRHQNEIELEEDNIEENVIKLDDVEEFETKSDNKSYIKQINTYATPPNQVKMSRYENSTHAVLVDRTFILNNKLKMIFGIIMSLIMIFEITLLLLVFKGIELINGSDKIYFIMSYIFVAIFAMICIIPYFIRANSHKSNNFKFKDSMWFGILTFFVCSILIYCCNALAGFEISNFKYFAVELILPIILSLNFLISPLIYTVLIKKKSFYD